MPHPFNEAQMAILEEYWQIDREGHNKRWSRRLAVRCWKVGPMVTSQDVGRYFANRAARESGRPRATPLTLQQREMLEESFENNAYPYTGDVILLSYMAKLKPTKVKQWFEYQRKKHRRNRCFMRSRNYLVEQDMAAAAKMWRAYNKNPGGYAKQLWLGTISNNTGASTGKVADAAAEKEWEGKWGANGEDCDGEDCDDDGC